MADNITTRENKITSPADLRAILISNIEGVMEGRISVPQANAVVGLSAQIHASVRLDWDMRVYAAKNLGYHNAEILKWIAKDEA